MVEPNTIILSDNLELFYVHIINIEYLFKIRLIATIVILKFNFDMFLSKFGALFIITIYRHRKVIIE